MICLVRMYLSKQNNFIFCCCFNTAYSCFAGVFLLSHFRHLLNDNKTPNDKNIIRPLLAKKPKIIFRKKNIFNLEVTFYFIFPIVRKEVNWRRGGSDEVLDSVQFDQPGCFSEQVDGFTESVKT